MFLTDLPDVILKHLQTFLSNDDIHYFLNSNKYHLSSLKREIIYFSLNNEKSQEYVEDERFREIILSKVKDGRKQIGLSLDKKYELLDFSNILAHKIDFGRSSRCLLQNVSSQRYFSRTHAKDVPFVPMLQDLELYHCLSIEDLSSLSHLKKLKLSYASELTNITPLQNIPHLTFNVCPKIQDFSVLSRERQQFVSINRSSITNVSFLRNIQTVELYLCDQLIDVSPLYGIKNLLLMYCSSLQDISCLGNHYRLHISQCLSIKHGYECFRTVRHAELSELTVPDLSVFRDLKSLQISFFSSMGDRLFLLKDIPELNLLSNSYSDGKEVCDISHLRNIRLSFHYDIIRINDSIFPSQLVHLELENCDQIVKIINEGKTSIFHRLQSLHIRSCLIEHVHGLGDIPTVLLENCLKPCDISGLGRNRCVELEDCPEIRDASSLATVSIVTIRDCEGIVDYSCLSSVPRLKIVR